jgi:hypothetical protein
MTGRYTIGNGSEGVSLGERGGKGAPVLGTFRGRREFVLTGDIVYWGLQDIYTRRFWKWSHCS